MFALTAQYLVKVDDVFWRAENAHWTRYLVIFCRSLSVDLPVEVCSRAAATAVSRHNNNNNNNNSYDKWRFPKVGFPKMDCLQWNILQLWPFISYNWL